MSPDAPIDALINEQLTPFGITFQRPTHWLDRVEDEDPANPTFLYWNEDAGSFRITPITIDRPLSGYLESAVETERTDRDAPSIVSSGANRMWRWTTDDVTEGTRIQFHLSGIAGLAVLCSYAFAPAAQDEALGARELEAVWAVLASLRVSGATLDVR